MSQSPQLVTVGPQSFPNQPTKEIQMADIEEAADALIGRYVIVRCSGAGVHAGTIKSRTPKEVTLVGARRLWRWRVKDNAGVSLSDLAVNGLDKKDTKISAPVEVLLSDYHEIIICSQEAAESIAAFAVAKAA